MLPQIAPRGCLPGWPRCGATARAGAAPALAASMYRGC